MRFSRRAARVGRRIEQRAAGAVEYIVNDVIVGMRVFVLRYAGQFLLPALLLIPRGMQAARMDTLKSAVHASAAAPVVVDRTLLHLVRGDFVMIAAHRAVRRRIRRHKHMVLQLTRFRIARHITGGNACILMIADRAADAAHAGLAAKAVAQRFSFGLAAGAAGLCFRAGRSRPIVAQCFSLGLTAGAAGLCFRAGRSRPAVAQRFSLGLAAGAAGLCFRAGRSRPIVAQRFSLGCAAKAAGLCFRAGRSIPLVSTGLHIAAGTASITIAKVMRLARRTSLILRRNKLLTTSAVKHIMDNIMIRVCVFIIRSAGKLFFPALLRIICQHTMRMLTHISAHLTRTILIAPVVFRTFLRQRSRRAGAEHRRQQQRAQQFPLHIDTSPSETVARQRAYEQ